MPRARCLIVAAAVLALAPGARAGLIGDSVAFTISSTAGFGWASGPVIVGPGVEYVEGGFEFDVDATSLTIRGREAFCGFATCAPGSTLSIQLSSLDLDGPLRGVTVDTLLTGVSPTFTSTSIRLAWADQPTPAGIFLTATFVSAVSEPAALAIFGAGMLGLGLARRRRG